MYSLVYMKSVRVTAGNEKHGTFNHAAPAEMGRPCHPDAVQPTPAPYSILRVAAGTASCWRPEEALL